jgi:type I restriction enzyme S subunit
MKRKLGDLAIIVKSKDSVEKIDRNKYVTTENMISNRGGVSFPSSTVPKQNKLDTFDKDDVLVSNIRPYFKKIWKAPFSGYKSGDVLAFRTKDRDILSQEYLYILLESDRFFEYMTTTAKGTKMPRGDKKAIAEFPFDLPSIDIQKKRSHQIEVIEQKISLNQQINANLLNLANTLFKHYFPDINTGTDKIGDYIKNFDKLRKPLSKKQRSEIPGKYRYIGATSVNDHIDKYNFDGIYLLLGEDGTVQDEYGFPILQYTFGKFWPNNHAHVLQGKNVSTEWLYLYFSQRNISGIVTGAVQKKVSQKNMNSLKFKLPDSQELKKFDKIIQPLFSKIRSTKLENYQLEELKRVLLTKLF